MLDSKPLRGMLLAGGFVGAAFLTAGLPGLVLTLPACVVAVIVSKTEAGPSIWHVLAGGVLAVVLIALWPMQLALREPHLLMQWWQQGVCDVTPRPGGRRLCAAPGMVRWSAARVW